MSNTNEILEPISKITESMRTGEDVVADPNNTNSLPSIFDMKLPENNAVNLSGTSHYLAPSQADEYLVEGALLRCNQGSLTIPLEVPDGHSVNSAEKKKINIKDCKPDVNVYSFGSCKRNLHSQTCEGYKILDDKWINTKIDIFNTEKISNEEAVSRYSLLLCKRGGIIIPVTSGQGQYMEEIPFEFLSRQFRLLSWVNGHIPDYAIYGADPVNLCTGNFIYQKEDLYIPGRVPLSFCRFYNSIGIMEDRNKEYTIGNNWRHNYDLRISAGENEEITVYLGDGREIVYKRDAQNEFQPLFGGNERLLSNNIGYEFISDTAYISYFDKNGRLICQKDKNNNSISFKYNDCNQLILAKTNTGSYLNFLYNEEGRLIEVSDHIGREVSLQYQYGILTRVENPMGYSYHYEYDEGGYLNRIITPRGICGLHNTYDSFGRTLKQVMPDGKVIKMQYDDNCNKNYTLERDGVLTAYEHDNRMRHVKTIDAIGNESFSYNDRNQIIVWKDKNGNKTLFTYDKNGNMTMVTTAENVKYFFRYNGLNQLTEAIGPEGQKICYEYDGTGNINKITNSFGDIISISRQEHGLIRMIEWPDYTKERFCYDERYNLIQWEESTGTIHKYEYDELNRITVYIDTNGNRTSYEYNKMNHISRKMNQLGDVQEYEYNASGMLIKFTDYDKSSIRWKYDECNRIKEIKNKDGNILKYKYDDMGRINEIIYPNGGHIVYIYNHLDKVIQMNNASGEKWNFEYDAHGNLIIEKKDGKKEKEYKYDTLNRLRKVTLANGSCAAYQYNLCGKISCITDSMGNELRFQYDKEGRLIKKKLRSGRGICYSYHCMGGVDTITYSSGRKEKYQYGPGGRLEKIIYFNGKKKNLIYDNVGNLIEEIENTGQKVKYTYDALNRLTALKSSLNKSLWFEYDKVGNLISVSDEEGFRTSYQYTLGGRLKGVKDVFGNGIRYQYDTMGNLCEICQFMKESNNEFKIRYDYDSSGFPTSIVDNSGYREIYKYKSGRLVEKIDKDGFVTRSSYTEEGELACIQYGDNRHAEYVYDKLHRLTQIKDWNGKTTIERDASGRILSVTNFDGKRVEYIYGDLGQRTKVIYPDGMTVNYYYDDKIRLKSISVGSNYVNYKYDSLERLYKKEFTGGLYVEYSYNAQGMLCKLVYADLSGILESLEYSYDENGNKEEIKQYRKGIPDENGVYKYCYDKLNFLIEVKKNGQTTERYQYDGKGNRIWKEAGGKEYLYFYNDLNQLILCEEKGEPNNTYEYRYDKRGNLVEEKCKNRVRYFTYGADNRLEKVELLEKGDIIVKVEYGYNGLGQRISESVIKDGATKRTNYIVDLTKKTNNLLQIERDNCIESYISDNHILGRSVKGKLQFNLLDEMGSTLRLQWENGNTDSIFGYGSFGEDLFGNQGEKQPFGYTGYRYDSVAGTYYAQAREYKAELGRFFSNDKLKYSNFVKNMSFNLYTYCMNNPINYVDHGGNDVYYFFDPETFNEEHEPLDTSNAMSDRNDIISELGFEPTEVHTIPVSSREDFVREWNGMKDEYIDAVIIYTHAGPGAFQFGHDSKTRYKAEEYSESSANAGNDLKKKDINLLISLGCNTGNEIKMENEDLYDTSRFMPEFLLNELGINYVVAASGNVRHSDIDNNHVMSVVDYRQTRAQYFPDFYFYRIPRTIDGYFNLFYQNGDIQMYDKYLNVAQIIQHAQGIQFSLETQ